MHKKSSEVFMISSLLGKDMEIGCEAFNMYLVMINFSPHFTGWKIGNRSPITKLLRTVNRKV